MDRDLSVQTEQFRSEIKQAGEEVVFGTFPKKAVLTDFYRELQQLILSTENLDSPFHEATLAKVDTTVYPPPSEYSETDSLSKKRKISDNACSPNETLFPQMAENDTQHARLSNIVLENKHVKRLHSIIKKECEELVASIDKVRLWVTLAIPKIEDGDNFGSLDKSYPLDGNALTSSQGVGVQEEILNELHRAQDCVYNLRDSPRQHHLARAKICSKLIKYPYVEDYTSALIEHDEKQIFNARHYLLDIRDLYAALTDITQKNIIKIRTPRSNNNSGLY
ncbi:proteasome activator pa28 REG alpha/beta subunit [Lentinula aff. detonsa]|uniref:Proteasome activator pa28 REG alpha/beta subunit n=1 Tax=Lentinula aff. detonsa TaxID=2804958 RepID=A0AA38ND56_9AGAR|nr:proteasome activator pa28 REG alpha/beta subunit [Lentinula aff. detonsa]KAJ3799358.1 proteasome activator pa28 REG alpha/beta subunit [Lentinula aff. detonsa]